MNKKKIMKGNKGITLITLAITIIVLLILAGISINTLVSDNGIIKQALKSTNSAKEFENDFNKKQSSLISEISGSNKANLVCNNVGEDFVTVKMGGAGANKYQFSLDGTNWSAEQSENEYTFKNLTKAVVNKDNYKDVTGTEYKVYSKAIDSDGNELVYGPIKVKTSVVVEADSKYLEYEELNGEITITGILYDQDYTTTSIAEMESMLASPEKILIPSYIDGKPVAKISEELIKEITTTLKEKDENVHAWITKDRDTDTTFNLATNEQVNKETEAPNRQILYGNSNKADFYLLYENTYKTLTEYTSRSDATAQGNFKIRSYELIIPPSVKEYTNSIKVSNIKNIIQSVAFLNNNESMMFNTKLAIGKDKIIFAGLFNFDKVDKSDYAKLTFLGKKNLNEIQNNDSLNTALKQATNSKIEFIN